MVTKEFFERSSMEVAIDLGLRTLRFSRQGNLLVPDLTREVLINRTVAYGSERGYNPAKTADGKVRKSAQGGLQEAGLIDMYFTPYGYILAISTGREGEFSEISIHGGLPISGFQGSGNLDQLLNGPIKLTKGLGIDKEVAKMLHGKPVYDNNMIEVTGEKLPGTYALDPAKISKDALGSFSFRRN